MIKLIRFNMLFILLCTLLGCMEEIHVNSYVQKDVTLFLSAAPIDFLNTDSRSVAADVDEGLGSSYVISDFWIFQYNKNGALVGKPAYYRTGGKSSQQVSVLLPSEPGVENSYTTVFIANTHNNSLDQKIKVNTLEDLKQSCKIVESSSDLYQLGFNDLIMNGSCQVTSETQKIECKLYRNVAKINVNIVNDVSSGITITSVQLKNVSNKLYYADHFYDGQESFPNTSHVTFIDFERDAIDIRPGGNHSLKYYLTRNMKGNNMADSEYNKNSDAPTYATYIEVMALHNERNTPIRYSFYLGKNSTNNYDIEPNYQYDINLKFNNMGAADDFRVEDLSEVVLNDANSFIVNPIENVGIKYTVLISERINRFWNSSHGKLTENSTSENAIKWSDYLIDGSNEWLAEVIWQDVDKQVIKFCQEDGSLRDIYEGGAEGTSFSFVPTAEAVNTPCNVLIGVRSSKDDWDLYRDGYMWSWHIWLTDYNPDSYKEVSDERYVYELPGNVGSLHKYVSFDTNEKFKGKFMMDRNLGAKSYTSSPNITSSELADVTGMYYAYGRKDPFPGVELYDITGTKKNFDYSGAEKSDRDYIIEQGPAYIYASVVKPYIFFKIGTSGGNEWVKNNPLSQYDWNDLNKEAVNGNGKSFFDPCPPGWKVPHYTVWDGLGKSNEVYASNCYDWVDLSKNEFNVYSGWLIYLSGIEGWNNRLEHADNIAYFPAGSYIANASGKLSALGGNGGLWTSTPNGENAYYLYIANNNKYFFRYNVGFVRYNGFPVRCIQE